MMATQRAYDFALALRSHQPPIAGRSTLVPAHWIAGIAGSCPPAYAAPLARFRDPWGGAGDAF